MVMRKMAGLLMVCVMLLTVTSCKGSSEIKTEKIALNFASEVARGGYRVVSTSELKTWLDQKKEMLIIDTMPLEASYKKNHIPGAKPFEFPIPEVKELDKEKMASFEKLLGPDKNKLIVFYCGFTTCTRSHNGALWAVKLGYKNVYRHPGGIKAWVEGKNPVEKGA